MAKGKNQGFQNFPGTNLANFSLAQTFFSFLFFFFFGRNLNYLNVVLLFLHCFCPSCFRGMFPASINQKGYFFFCHKIRATHLAKKKSGEVRGNGGCEGQLKDCFVSPCFKKLTFFVLQNMKSFK